MANLPSEIKVKVTSLEPVAELLRILAANLSKLPPEVIDALEQFASEINNDDC